MGSELWVALGGFVTTMGGSFATWFFTRKKYNSEVDSQVIENMAKSLKFWEDESKANRERLNELLAETKELREENTKLQQDVNNLRDEVSSAMKTICYDFSCSHRIKTSAEAQKLVKNMKKTARKSKGDCAKKNE